MPEQMLVNPFTPSAGQRPPFVAGREPEIEAFKKLLNQDKVMKNMVITGLRGIGKTVLLDEFKPLALNAKWLWAGTELSESASVSEDTIAIRILSDLSVLTSQLLSVKKSKTGFSQDQNEVALDYASLETFYKAQGGLVSDKLKATLEYIWNGVKTIPEIKGIVFAYDEAQEMNDQDKKGQFPLSVLLDVFSSLQRRGFPFVLLLVGLPTLYPKIVESRGYSERMFDVHILGALSEEDSRKAITEPIKQKKSQIGLSDNSVELIVQHAGGYPYFIQFMCKEVFDSFIAQKKQGVDEAAIGVPIAEIVAKLDIEFFEPKWNKATDRERELLAVVATLPNCHDEFTIKEAVEQEKNYHIPHTMGDSQINQLLSRLSKKGLVFRTPRHGKYTFGVPLLGEYVKRQMPLERIGG